MVDHLRLNFSHHFDGVIWNMIAWAAGDCLILEVRNIQDKQVRFSALNFKRNTFIWRDRVLEETWWVNLTMVFDGVIIFTIYLDTNNPDKKGILAYSYENLELLWWNNDFSVSALTTKGIKGFTSRMGLNEVTLEIHSGKEINNDPEEKPLEITGLRKPVQYPEGTEYFETVKTFLAKRLNLNAVFALEYLETEKIIVISCYIRNTDADDLTNFLLVLSRDGEFLMKESISPQVKGIGLDTFFVLDGSLFFVKNKTELVSYTIL